MSSSMPASSSSRGTTTPGTNDGSFAPKSLTVPGLSAHLSENTGAQRLKVAIALLDTGIRRRAETEFTEPVSFAVIKSELRGVCPGVSDEDFDAAWTGIQEKAEDVSAMEKLWDDAERSGDWDGFDDYAWDASVEKEDFLVEDEEDGSQFVEVHDYAGTIISDYEARMHEELNGLVNRPGAVDAATPSPADVTFGPTSSTGSGVA